MFLFTSAAPRVTPPSPPPGWIPYPWQNYGTAPEPKLDSMPQGTPITLRSVLLNDFEPTPKLGETWSVYDRAESFARCAATAVTRYPTQQHVLYGAAPITAAQADPAKKGVEDTQLERLSPLYRTMGRLNVWLALDLSFGPAQTMEGWKYATPKRIARVNAIRALYQVVPVLILGVRRGGGGAYADTTPHTEDELRAMAIEARKSGAIVGVFAHLFSEQAAREAGWAYGVLADALAPSGLKPRAGVPTVGPGADARGGM